MPRHTGKQAATDASAVLRDDEMSPRSKSAAASALSQAAPPEKDTSAEVARTASSVLRDGRTSDASKSAAGSALSQRAPGDGE